MKQDNVMRKVKIDKVTLNIGCGTDQNKMEKAESLLKSITGITPVKTKSKKRIAGWGLRPGLPIGVRVTLRNEEAIEVLKRCITAKEKRLRKSMFDNNGNIAFGIEEYIDIPGVNYDPKIGIIGLQVTTTLKRAGFRVKLRKEQPQKLPVRHRITQQEAITFAQENFGVTVE